MYAVPQVAKDLCKTPIHPQLVWLEDARSRSTSVLFRRAEADAAEKAVGQDLDSLEIPQIRRQLVGTHRFTTRFFNRNQMVQPKRILGGPRCYSLAATTSYLLTKRAHSTDFIEMLDSGDALTRVTLGGPSCTSGVWGGTCSGLRRSRCHAQSAVSSPESEMTLLRSRSWPKGLHRGPVSGSVPTPRDRSSRSSNKAY